MAVLTRFRSGDTLAAHERFVPVSQILMTSTLHYDNARIAQQLFNNEAKNLQGLNDRLGVRATCRDGWIKLEGEEENVAIAASLFQSLESALKAGVTIRNRDFAYALNTVATEGPYALVSLYTTTLQTSAWSRAELRPERKAQKQAKRRKSRPQEKPLEVRGVRRSFSQSPVRLRAGLLVLFMELVAARQGR